MEAILERLRQRGGRVTTARRAVVAALVVGAGHVTAEDLVAAVQRSHPDVHRSTVYRCLEALEELGVIEHVHLGHGAAVYHLAEDRHQHLVCDRCSSVVEVPEELFGELRGRLQRDYGFAASSSHFAVVGRCQSCAGEDAATRAPRARR